MVRFAGTAIAAERDFGGAGLRSPPRDHGENARKQMNGDASRRDLRRTVISL
jgi:hypothetical protein